VFWERPDVLYASLHVDPAAGWFPHLVGSADERGAAAGVGTTVNAPLAPGTGDPGWLAALDGLLGHLTTYRPEALVVSLGVDAAGADPESPLDVTTDGFAAAGARLAALGLPTVLVHEGGYALDRLGVDTVAVVRPFGAGDR
jgi:acetoin utilization deacetylase AcuC-like enzyme